MKYHSPVLVVHLVSFLLRLPAVSSQSGTLDVDVDINNVNHDLTEGNLAQALPVDYSLSQFTDGAVSNSLQTSCPPGFYCPLGGTSAPVPCPAGTYQTGLAMTMLSRCLHCTEGNYCPSPSILPTPCLQGTYLTGTGFSTSAQCVLCDQGTFQTGTGIIASAQCTACLPGTFQTGSGVSSSVQCLLCDRGTYQSAHRAVSSASCLDCHQGTYQTGTGIVSSVQCTSCLAGTYQPVLRAINASQCLPCPTGFFCPTNSSNQTVPCAMGTYQPLLGATSSMQCLTCPTGGYCPMNSTLVLACPPGTFQPTTRVTNLSGCLTTTIGHFSPPNASMQTICPAGSKCDTAGLAAPVPCGRGFFQSLTGQSLCLLCPVGQYCQFETTWGPQGCPPGTYSNLTGATAASNCNDSVVGGYVTPNASFITICPVGHLCNTTRLTAPIPCGPGLFQNVTGQTVCRRCPIPGFCPTATTDQPLTCPAGHLCNVEGLAAPIPCGLGLFQPNTGQTVCLACPVGQYCPLTNTSTPIDCNAGSFRAATGAQTQAHCAACPLGQFCIAGTSVPTNCPAGTFRNTTGALNLAGCAACSVGKFAFMSTGLTSDCLNCPANAYCSSPLSLAHCPLRTNSTAGSSSLLHCICNPGFRCTYSKRISLVVTISGNFSVTAFQNNVNGIQDRFKQAVANATKVSVAQVNITNVRLRAAGRRRRLLMTPSKQDTAAHFHLHVDHHSRHHAWKRVPDHHHQIVWPSTRPVLVKRKPAVILPRPDAEEGQQTLLDIATVVHGAHEVNHLDHYLAHAAIRMPEHQTSVPDESGMGRSTPNHHSHRFSHDLNNHWIADPRQAGGLRHTHHHELVVTHSNE